MATQKDLDQITDLLKMYKDVTDDFTHEGECVKNVVTVLEEYITAHKWLINEKIPYEITLDQAFFSWYENVYKQQKYAMNSANILLQLAHLTSFEVFDLVSKARYFLSQKFPDKNITYEEAVKKVIVENTKKFLTKLFFKIVSFFTKKK